MSGLVTLASGETLALPQVKDYLLECSDGSACDSIEVHCLCESLRPFALEEAAYLTVLYGKTRVFYGIVDEVLVRRDGAGFTLSVFARNLAAKLMDSDAKELVYAQASWQDIYQHHVAPYGIAVSCEGALANVSEFAVSAGSSEWSVIERFCKQHNGTNLRVDTYGVLQIGAGRTGAVRYVGTSHPVTQVSYRVRRYGVLGRVLVYESGLETPSVIEDSAALARGITAQRRVTLAKGSGEARRQRVGAQRLQQSAQQARLARICLPIPFAAAVGDVLDVAQLGARFLVLEARFTPGESELTMKQEEN